MSARSRSVSRIAGSDAGVVTMTIDSGGLPIHTDATAAIRERIFLEGNIYVDLQPGSPSAPVLRSGATLPAANTSGPVQLNRVLSSLDASARANLQTLLKGLGASLSAPPSPAQDATQDPLVRGLTGGQSLNAALQYSAQAFKASAIVNEALLGTQPNDLSQAVSGSRQVFGALAASPYAAAGSDHELQRHDGDACLASDRARPDDRDASRAAAQRRRRRQRTGRVVRADAGVRTRDPPGPA